MRKTLPHAELVLSDGCTVCSDAVPRFACAFSGDAPRVPRRPRGVLHVARESRPRDRGRPRARGLHRLARHVAQRPRQARACVDRPEAGRRPPVPPACAGAGPAARRAARAEAAAAPPRGAEARRGRAGARVARGRRPARAAQPRARRARLLRGPAQRRGVQPRSRRRRLRAGARARARGQGREGPRRPARRGSGVLGLALSPRRTARSRAWRERCPLPLGARQAARHVDAAPPDPAPAQAAPRLRDAPARGRRRPADDPGAARPLVAVDDADVQPRRREAAAQGLRLGAPPVVNEVDAYLAVRAARLAPRAVEAYRRDLADLTTFLGGSPADATTAQLETYVAQMRADGLKATTNDRRIAAVRGFYRHQQLVGARGGTPAAALGLPRRRRALPKTLSPGEVERLIDAATGTTPRNLRDQALVELLYGGGLRVSEAVGLERGAVDLDDRYVRVIGKGSKERIVPLGRPAVDALLRYLSRGRPYLDKRHRPELFLNAQGGALTRAGAFLILR